MAAQINHPNVVALYDRGVHEGMLFLVMELVDGMPLSTLIDTSGTLALHRALGFAEQICAALEATHRAGVVHFDIKPDNVMVTAAGVAKVVDFGIAGLVRAQQLSVVHSSRLAPVATLEYAAPEQFTAERGDSRSDLYALGGVLFAMLAGRAPFTGYSPWEMVAAKTSSDAPRLEYVRPGLPSPLNDLVARLLERDPARRPPNARVVRERLAQLLADPGPDRDEPRAAATMPAESIAYVTALPEVALPTLVSRNAANVGGPRQLPPDTGLFTGREDELEALFALAEQAHTRDAPGTVVISAIDGMGGMGKTALAIRAAHRLAPRFPDGQLFLDLYGFTQGTAPRDPSDALAALLGSLGIPPQQIPADLETRAAFYRDRLAGTRTLILLDNAADEAQVRPLLPASDTCLVLVTSRRRLKALDDALPLSLDVLPLAEAVALSRKAARLGEDPRNEPLLEQAAELCGRLPLALVIAGALLRTGGKAWNLSILIDRLAARRPGDELAGYADEARSLQAVFDLSYQHLSEDLQRLFRRLGLLPGPEIDAYAAAALLDTDPDQADRLLQRLADHSLLTGSSPGRYRLHDLIRAHARTLATTSDSESERDATLDRLLHYYAHTAQGASVLIARYPRTAPDGPAPAFAPALPDPDAARTWLRIEQPNLDAAFIHADTHALDVHAIALAAGLAEILLSDGPRTRSLEIHQAAADSAERQSHATAHADALNDLGRVRQLTGDTSEASDALDRALEIYRALGNHLGEANTLTDLGQVRYKIGEVPEADDTLSRALEIYRALGNRHGEANTLAFLGRVRRLTGDASGAGDALSRALEIYRTLGNRLGEANTLVYLGDLRQLTGDTAGASDASVRALAVFRALGERLGEANALCSLGQVRQMTGDFPGAEDALSQALEIFRALGIRGNEAWALNHYAATFAAAGQRPRAFELYQQALAMNRELNKPDDEAVSLEGIGECHLATGDSTQGAANLHQALEIYQRLGIRADIERVQARLVHVSDIAGTAADTSSET